MRTLQSALLVGAVCLASHATGASALWPAPAEASNGTATVVVMPGKGFFSSSIASVFLEEAFERYTLLTFPHNTESMDTPTGITGLKVVIDQETDSEAPPQLDTNESYTLNVPSCAGCVATIVAATRYGALRGLESFSQLVRFDFDTESYFIQGAPWQIDDGPRFPHRGLMVDTGRHFLPLAALRSIIDTLPYAKLNVLHWHMVDTQSFPFQSKTQPKLWEGSFSGQERYTQEEVLDIVSYAKSRGVRVMVEFDMPGHADSWCTGYPEICPSPTCKSPLNVARDGTFTFIEDLLGESTGGKAGGGLFPENFIHLGGDEVDTSCWTKTPSVSKWLQSKNMSGDDAYAYFVKRVAHIALSQGKRPVQWSEVWDHFKAQLPIETIVHVWKSNTNVTEVVANGYNVIRNVGYDKTSWYLDNLNVKWDSVYQNEPCDGIPTEQLCGKVLGGHGEMWGETVDGSDLQSTVWPRLAAIAEKLWSPREKTTNSAAALPRIEDFRCLLLQRGVAAAVVQNPVARAAPSGPGSCSQRPSRNREGRQPRFGLISKSSMSQPLV